MAKRVLVIDDDRNTVEYLSVALSEHGYEPDAAYDGNEGLRKIRQKKPDLVVLDVMMPKRSGFVVFNELKRDERFRELPILMLTSVGAVVEEQERHKDETFEKPYEPLREVLQKKVRELRGEGVVHPEMFVDKPVDPETFIDRVGQLIGTGASELPAVPA